MDNNSFLEMQAYLQLRPMVHCSTFGALKKIDNVNDTGICADSKALKREVNIWQFKLLKQFYWVFTASDI
jgi:hypothetical protein